MDILTSIILLKYEHIPIFWYLEKVNCMNSSLKKKLLQIHHFVIHTFVPHNTWAHGLLVYRLTHIPLNYKSFDKLREWSLWLYPKFTYPSYVSKLRQISKMNINGSLKNEMTKLHVFRTKCDVYEKNANLVISFDLIQ